MAVSARAYFRLVGTNRNFRRLWLAQIISELGDWLYIVVIYTLLLQLTNSARSVAIAFVLQVLPQFFVSPAAGIVNDRLSRKRVMIAADLARAVIVLLMIFATRAQSVPLIYCLLFIETVMWAFFEPGRSAIMPNITKPEELTAANALSSMTWSLNLALGSGLGGAVAVYLGRDPVFVLDSLSFIASALLVRGIDAKEPHLEGARPLSVRDLFDFSPFVEGVRYISRESRLLALLSVKAGIGLLATHWVLLPIYGERIFPVKATGFDPQRGAMLAMSALMASRGVGSLLGPWFGGIWASENRARLRAGILFGFLLGSAGFFCLSGAPSLLTASLAMMLANAGTSIGWVFSTTLLQFHTDDRFRGRVFSADFAFLVVSMSLATYAAGQLVDSGVPPRAVAFGTGVVAIIPSVAWLLAMRLWKTSASSASPR